MGPAAILQHQLTDYRQCIQHLPQELNFTFPSYRWENAGTEKFTAHTAGSDEVLTNTLCSGCRGQSGMEE
jgi:hypothetical protein